MKNLYVILILLSIGLTLITVSCRKDQNKEQLPEELIDEAGETHQVGLENTPGVQVDLNDVILPNGSRLMDFELLYDRAWISAHRSWLPAKYAKLLAVPEKQSQATPASSVVGPQAIKNRLIARAQVYADRLVTDTNFDMLVKDKQAPKQLYGLAYVFGSRNHNVLSRSTEGCTEQLYGLDCSGMLMEIMAAAELPVSGSAADLSQPSLWKKALQDMGGDFNYLDVATYTSKEMPLAQVEAGDVIYFYGVDKRGKTGIVHIGIVLVDPTGQLKIYQSNGRQSDQCQKNYDVNHGPRRIPVSAPMTQKGWNFTDYGILRLKAKLDGKWNAYIRCSGATTDVIRLDLTFPAVQNGAFKVTGTGTDYDGTAISVAIDGNYYFEQKLLTGTIVYTFPTKPASRRSDKFKADLSYDDTGYSALEKVVDNGGCTAQIRLVNLQSSKTPASLPFGVTPAVPCNCSISGHTN